MILSTFAMRKVIENSFPVKVAALWTAFLLSLLFHVQLALMPLFHGLSVVETRADEAVSMEFAMWFVLIFFSLPLFALLGCFFSPTLGFCKLHFGMTLVYSVLNFLHLALDASIAAPSYQLALMVLLFCIGFLLNLVSYHWMKAMSSVKKLAAHS